jgi:hypothetical protein
MAIWQVTSVPETISELMRNSVAMAVVPPEPSSHTSDMSLKVMVVLFCVSGTEQDVCKTVAVVPDTEACAAHGSAFPAGAVKTVDEAKVQIVVSA